MDKISSEQIKGYLKKNGIDAEIVPLKDTLGNQQLFRVNIKGAINQRRKKEIEQIIQSRFTTKVTDIRFINENMHYDYNGSHMLVYDIERKYDNVFSGKLQVQIDDNVYGYDVLFDDMKGIIEWDKDWNEINLSHVEDGTSRDFKGLIDMFNIDLQNHVNIDRHAKKKQAKKLGKKKDAKLTEILINYDQAKGMVSYLTVKNLDMDNTSFNKMVQELSGQALYVTYQKRESDSSPAPAQLFIGRSGTYMNDHDMTNITKIFSKFGVDTSNFKYINVRNISLLPASALIKTSIKDDQKRDL